MKLCLVLVAILVATLASCATADVNAPAYSGGNGSTLQTAVVVLGAKTDDEFSAAEAKWLAEKFPGYRVESGSYVVGSGAHHQVNVVLADGSRRVVYFDLSGFGS